MRDFAAEAKERWEAEREAKARLSKRGITDPRLNLKDGKPRADHEKYHEECKLYDSEMADEIYRCLNKSDQGTIITEPRKTWADNAYN